MTKHELAAKLDTLADSHGFFYGFKGITVDPFRLRPLEMCRGTLNVQTLTFSFFPFANPSQPYKIAVSFNMRGNDPRRMSTRKRMPLLNTSSKWPRKRKSFALGANWWLWSLKWHSFPTDPWARQLQLLQQAAAKTRKKTMALNSSLRASFRMENNNKEIMNDYFVWHLEGRLSANLPQRFPDHRK